MASDGKDLRESAKAALASVVRLLGEFEQNQAAERRLSVEELSCIANNLKYASRLLLEILSALPAGSKSFASTAITSQQILKDGGYRGDEAAEETFRRMEGRYTLVGWARLPG